MFEDSTFESQGRITTGSRRWSLAAFALNGSVLAAMIIFPLVHPEHIPHRFIDIAIAPPPAERAADPIQVRHHATSVQGVHLFTNLNLSAPRTIPQFIDKGPIGVSTAAPSGTLAMDMPGTGIPGGTDIFRAAPAKPVQPKPRGPIVISQGVAAGMVLHRILPVYPAIARASHTEGTVVLHVVISKDGAIEDLRVEGGLAMLQQAALDAIRQWRYRPYLLNSAPVAVETTSNVVFSLGR